MEIYLIKLFFSLFNISIAASFLILAVALFRLVFKKAPKKVLCALWALVGLRLLLPFSLESKHSLVPRALDLGVNTVVVGETDYSFNVYSQLERGSTDYIAVVENTTPPREVSEAAKSKPLVEFKETFIAIIWAAGMGIMLVYMLGSYVRVKRSVSINVPYEGRKNVFFADNAQTAFILGIAKPKIYLPSGIAEKDIPLVLAHENAHLKRLDHIIKPLGFLFLSVYWFNPLLWLAYVLLCRDVEAACDENVLRSAGEDSRFDYSEALIRLSTKQRKIAACPLAFGENGVKKRVKSIMNYKKPGFWVIFAAVFAVVVIGVCFFTAPKSSVNLPDIPFVKSKVTDEKLDKAISAVLLNEADRKYLKGEISTQGHEIFGIDESETLTKVYMYIWVENFGFFNGKFIGISGSNMPVVMTFKKTAENYELTEYKEPEDGSRNFDSIKEMFPAKYRKYALRTPEKIKKSVKEQCFDTARSYLKSIGRNEEVGDYGDVHHIYADEVFKVSNEQRDALYEVIGKYSPFQYEHGNFERIINGVRYVFATDYLKSENKIVLTKYEYETRKVLECHEIDVNTAKEIEAKAPALYTSTLNSEYVNEQGNGRENTTLSAVEIE